jgi:hypothetical protein
MTDYEPWAGSRFSTDVGRASEYEKLPERCKKARREYAGKREPRCCGGKGCQTCWRVYWAKHGGDPRWVNR